MSDQEIAVAVVQKFLPLAQGGTSMMLHLSIRGDGLLTARGIYNATYVPPINRARTGFGRHPDDTLEVKRDITYRGKTLDEVLTPMTQVVIHNWTKAWVPGSKFLDIPRPERRAALVRLRNDAEVWLENNWKIPDRIAALEQMLAELKRQQSTAA